MPARCLTEKGPRLALAVVTLIASTLTGCGAYAREAAAPEGPPPALLDLVDEGADVALDARVASLARSPHFDLVAEALAGDAAARDDGPWLVDLARRTEQLVGAGWLAPDESFETLVLLRGRYGPEDVHRMTLGEANLREERRAGLRLVTRGDRALALVGAHTIALGDARRVRAALARLERGTPRRSEKDAVAALAARGRPAGAEVMVSVRVDARVARLLADIAAAEGTGELRGVSVDLDVERGLGIHVELAAESAEAASRLLPIVEERAAALRESALVQVLGLGPALAAARAASAGSAVVARAFVDAASLEVAIAAARELAIELARPAPRSSP